MNAKIQTIASVFTVFCVLLMKVRAQSPSPCLYNSTHCACSRIPQPGNCLRTISDGTCAVEQCKSTGMTCDCSGTSICSIESCSHNVAADGSLSSSLQIGSTVSCELSQNIQCVRLMGAMLAENTQSTPTEFRQLQFGQPSVSHMFNMSTFVDTGNVLRTGNIVHNIWPDEAILTNRFIHIRLYENVARTETYLCAILNGYTSPPDGRRLATLDFEIEGLGGQTLSWVVCDDPQECFGGPSSTLNGRHSVTDYVTDGWCVSPVENNGNAIRVTFSNVEGMLGLELQAPGFQQTYRWTDPPQYGMAGAVDADGLSVGGSASFIVNLAGIPVPAS